MGQNRCCEAAMRGPAQEISPATFRGARFTTNSACPPSISFGYGRYFFMPTRMERAWSPKSTRSRTSFSERATSSTADVDLVEVRGGDEGFDGRRIHVPLFAEARSIASNSVSLKRQPSASRLVLA